MNSNKIFIGTIMQHIYDNRAEKFMPLSVPIKENAVLIRTKNGFYVDVEELYLILLDIVYLSVESYKERYSDKKFIDGIYRLLEMPTEIFREQWIDSSPNSNIYVDETSLKPYVASKQNISIVKLQRELYSQRDKRQ